MFIFHIFEDWGPGLLNTVKILFFATFLKNFETHPIWFIHCAGFGWAIFNLEIHVRSGKICWIDFWKFLPLNFFHLIFLEIFLFGFGSHGYILSFLYCFPLGCCYCWCFLIFMESPLSLSCKRSFEFFIPVIILYFLRDLQTFFSSILLFSFHHEKHLKSIWGYQRYQFCSFCFGFVSGVVKLYLNACWSCLSYFKAFGSGGVGIAWAVSPSDSHFMVIQQNYFTRNLQLSAYWLGITSPWGWKS